MKLVTQNQKAWLRANVPDGPGYLAPQVQGSIVTANKAATQAASTAVDVATITADFNALLSKLKTAGIVL